MSIFAQGHVFAMEISSGEEFYIACDNTGTPLAVFSNNGLLLKQVSVCVCVLNVMQRRVFLFIGWNKFTNCYMFPIAHCNELTQNSVCVCVDAVHGIWRGLLWFKPRVCAGNWFPWRPVWSSDTTASFWRQRLRHSCWEVGFVSLLHSFNLWARQ